MLRGGEVVSRRAHNPEVVGSIPTPARILVFEMKFISIEDIVIGYSGLA